MTFTAWRRWPVPLVIGVLIGVVLAAVLTACGQAAPAPAPVAPAATAPAAAVETAAPEWLEVPAISLRTGTLTELGLAADGALQVPGDAVTAGWFTGGPKPGEPGPAVLAGHVDYKHVPGVFVRLKELRAGAEATVHRKDGTTALFKVYRVDRYPKATFPTDQVYGDTAGPELRLITCGGEFDRSTGNYLDNVVAYAKLV